jgi:hypothetical protein
MTTNEIEIGDMKMSKNEIVDDPENLRLVHEIDSIAVERLKNLNIKTVAEFLTKSTCLIRFRDKCDEGYFTRMEEFECKNDYAVEIIENLLLPDDDIYRETIEDWNLYDTDVWGEWERIHEIIDDVIDYSWTMNNRKETA